MYNSWEKRNRERVNGNLIAAAVILVIAALVYLLMYLGELFNAS